jgi:hypothetical protein
VVKTTKKENSKNMAIPNTSLTGLQVSDLFFNFGVRETSGTEHSAILEDAIEFAQYFLFDSDTERDEFVDALVEDFLNRV